ncbi:MAG: glycosyltransferase family 2 protein [Paracoccaceae bacterium]
MPTIPRFGVAICTFNSADVILDCLESLLASTGVALSIVVADNASTDGTVALLHDWAEGRMPYAPPADCPFELRPALRPVPLPLDGSTSPDFPHRIRLIETGVNGGFAAGVNAGLAALAAEPELDRFWILNPDSIVPADSARAFATCAIPETGFSLMGGRVMYLETPEQIQIDGGTINRWTGVTGNLNLGAPHKATAPVDPALLGFITGASMVASRAFYTAAGPMPEDYFLYYEEVDWALRRGALPLAYCSGGLVYHRAGTAIGSPTLGRPASPFSLYFKHRGRLRFMRRHFPAGVPTALLYSLAKAGQLLLKGYPIESWTLLAASFGLPPSAQVRERLSIEAQKRAF